MFNEQGSELDNNKLRNQEKFTNYWYPHIDGKDSNRKNVDDELDEVDTNTFLSFNQTLQICLKVSVGNNVQNLAKNNRKQIIDKIIIRTGNSGWHIRPPWKKECNDKNNASKFTNLLTATKTNSPTPNSGTTSIPSPGGNCVYIKTSSNNYGHKFLIVLKERISSLLLITLDKNNHVMKKQILLNWNTKNSAVTLCNSIKRN